MKKLLTHLLPFVIIGIAVVIFFYPTIRTGKLPVPSDTLIGMYHPWLDQAAVTNPAGVPFKNFLITDPIRQQIPWRKLVVDSAKKGIFPLWNAYNFSGTPLAGNIQAGLWYPLNILFFVMPFHVAWTVLIALQPLLAGIFLYLFLRGKKIVPGVASLAGIVWAFCGFSIAWLTWGTIVHTALWLPLILLSIDKVFESWMLKNTLVWTGLLVLALSFAVFAGHIQVALYIFGLSAAYGLFCIWHTHKRKNTWWLLAALLSGVFITSVQWVPFLQLVSRSARFIESNIWLKDGWFLPWQHIIQFVVPDYFGNPTTLNYWGTWNYGELVGYIGIVPLIFSLYALIARRDRLTGFFGIVLTFVVLLILPTPLAKLPFEMHIPFLSTLQPTRLMVLVDFCLIILAALGLDAYIKIPNKKIFFGISVTGMALAGLWIFTLRTLQMNPDGETSANYLVSRRNLMLPSVLWIAGSIIILLPMIFKKLRSGIFIFLLIVITVFDLVRFGWKFTPFTPVAYFFPTTKVVSFLQSQERPFRVMSLDNRILPPNVNAYYGIESVEGYDPIYDGRYEEFIAAVNRREANITPPFGFNRIITVPAIDSPLIALLNVKYILTLEEMKNPNLELMYREGNTRVYWYKKSLPRIYPVESIIVKESPQQIMDAMYDKTFNPAKTAVAEGLTAFESKPLTDKDIIQITGYSDSKLTAAVTLSAKRLVVTGNIYDSRWKATVDGQKADTYRINYIFIGLIVPEGNHIIKLSYE